MKCICCQCMSTICILWFILTRIDFFYIFHIRCVNHWISGWFKFSFLLFEDYTHLSCPSPLKLFRGAKRYFPIAPPLTKCLVERLHDMIARPTLTKLVVWGGITEGGRGCRGAMIPAKMTSEPQDSQNYLQAPQNWSPGLSDVTKPPAILSPRPAFWSPLVVIIFCLNLLA